ncbi:hypothetical protein BIV57_13535 [Mangrovactinospora gilvigrisea]|uniref:Replication-relaxation n=1 Tax=Mangrovactinospora gilvigrisea TaxID=1428644 RepID=A0A1J7BEK4_9ACTN|nr:replication-relaxation family protein [Mangrovactinospora gilvigrisea]OIV37005.1 hypothetical protein BIV57_13535 [Mangrovactinospora gilvigrisea]
MTTSPPAFAPSLSEFASGTLQLLYQHRMMTTRQLSTLLFPHRGKGSYVPRILAELRDAGLIDAVRAHGSGPLKSRPYVWFLTESGAELGCGPEQAQRAHQVTVESASGPRQQHTLAVNDTGVAFATHARRLGHECGSLDWVPEVAHRLRDGRARFASDHVISDAVLRCTHIAPSGRRSLLTVCLELDRATMATHRLAEKLDAYGRYFEYVPSYGDRPRRSAASTRPAWRYRYPAFPRLVVVFTGAAEPVLERRIRDLAALAAAQPRLARLAPNLLIGATTLTRLQDAGPWAPIFTPLLRSDTTARDLFLTGGEGG